VGNTLLPGCSGMEALPGRGSVLVKEEILQKQGVGGGGGDAAQVVALRF